MLKLYKSERLLPFLLLINIIATALTSLNAQWEGWNWRRAVSISNTSGSALTDYQTKVVLNSSTPFDFTKANSDGSDVRVTASDGTTTLPFWIESWNQAGQQATIWVKVPSIPTTGTIVYLYYGNTTANSVSNGRNTFRFFDDFELWNVGGGSTGWVDITSTPTPAKADNTAAVFNGKLYVFGGYGTNSNDYLNEVFEYDPGTNAWTTKTDMPTARWGMVAVEYNGLIYVFAGQGSVNNKNEVYNPANDTWDVSKAAVPANLAQQGLMGIKYGDKIHLFYKSFHYEYDPATDLYTQKANVPRQLTWSTCATVGSKIYIIGGYSYDVPTDACDVNYEYDPATDTWATKTPMPVSRYGATRENPVINGKIYVTHGHAGTPFFVTNYVYDPVANSWEQKGPAAHPRDGVGCGIINNKLYVVGGRDVPSAPYGVAWSEVYDPAADTWVPPSGPELWSTSGTSYVYADASAKYQGNYGLKISNSGTDFKYAQSVNGFGNVYALDFNWNVTSLGSGSGTWPETEIRVSELPNYAGNIYFYNITGTQTLRWYNGAFTTLTTSTRDSWHKVSFVRNGANNTITFDGTSYGPYTGTGYGQGTGIFRFGQYMQTTQYIDNVRVRSYVAIEPTANVGGEIPTTAFNVYLNSSTSAATGIIYPNTDWGVTSYEPDDWVFTTPVSFYIVPEVGSVFGASDITIQWNNTMYSYLGVENSGIFAGANFQFLYSTSGTTDQVLINAARTDNTNFTITAGQYIAKLNLNLLKPGYGPVSFTTLDFRAFNGLGGQLGVFMTGNNGQVKSYLGDVGAPGAPLVESTGDGEVNGPDLVLWSYAYWSGVGTVGMDNYKVKYDIGPTSDNTVYGMPDVDGEIQFEDLVIFAMSYGLSAGNIYPKINAEPTEPIELQLGEPIIAGSQTRIPLFVSGGVQNVRAMSLTFAGQFGKLVSVEKGSMLTEFTNHPVMLMSNADGSQVYVDLAVFGAEEAGINTEGEVLTLIFEGSAEININSAEVRNILNHPMAVNISGSEGLVPSEFALLQNYPNPFNPTTTINYELPAQAMVEISIFNALGERVATLVNEIKDAGRHTVEFNAEGYSSGIYFYQIKANEFVSVKKMILMK